jgi:hypothetical protein
LNHIRGCSVKKIERKGRTGIGFWILGLEVTLPEPSTKEGLDEKRADDFLSALFSLNLPFPCYRFIR